MKWKTLLMGALFLTAFSFNGVSVKADISEYKTWKQTDSRWGSKYISPSHDGTMSSAGCKITSQAILLVDAGIVTDSNFDPGVFMDSIYSKMPSDELPFQVMDGYNNSDIRFEGELRLADTSAEACYKHIKDMFAKDKHYMVAAVKSNHWAYLDSYDASSGLVHVCDPGASNSDDLMSDYPALNTVHVFSTTAEPFNKNRITTAEIEEVAAKVEETSQVYTSNAHRLSEYTDDQKTTLAVLQEKTMNAGEYAAFKWNMIVSQFNVPYVETLQDTLENNIAWKNFFSDGLSFNTNVYLKSIYGDNIPDDLTLPILQYLTDLKKEMTTPIERAVREDTVVSDGVTTAQPVEQETTGEFIDNKWATFLVGPYNPAYSNEVQAREIMSALAKNGNLKEIVESSLKNSNPYAGKKFKDILNAFGPSSKNLSNTFEVNFGGESSAYAYGKLGDIPQSYLDAMKSDMLKASIDTQTDSGSGMGYRTFYQASYNIDSSSPCWSTNDGYWARTMGMFSEHCTGNAIDFAQSYDMNGTAASSQSEQFTWLANNAHKYGFIWRFKINGDQETSSGKKTGTIFEDWHWRFVGVYHATKFWEKCSSDGVTGYDTNSNYLWEDYWEENIKGQDGYPSSTYQALTKYYDSDDTKCTYKELLEKSIDRTVSSQGSSVVTTQTEKIIKEKSLILQAYALLKDKNLNRSQIFNDKGEPAHVEDLWSDGCLTIKDILSVAGATANQTDEILLNDEKTLKDSLWNCIVDMAKSSSGTTQDLWDKVLESNYNQTINVPVYVRSDVTDFYNMIFVANATRIMGSTREALIEKYKGRNLYIDSWGNICVDVGGQFPIIYPAYANNLFANSSFDNGDIGKFAFNGKAITLTYDDLMSCVVKEDLDLDDFLTGTLSLCKVSETLNDNIKSNFTNATPVTSITESLDLMTSMLPDIPILSVDNESVYLSNKLLLTMYTRNTLPEEASLSWYSILANPVEGYEAFDYEKNVKSLAFASPKSRFHDAIVGNVYSGLKAGQPSSDFNNKMKLNMSVNATLTFDTKRLLSNFEALQPYNIWFETNFDKGVFPENYYTLSAQKSCVPLQEHVVKDPLQLFERKAVYGTDQYVLQNKAVSDALLKYPVEDICLIAQMWNTEIFKQLSLNALKLEQTPLSSGVHYDEVITVPNVLNSDNNRTLAFTRTSDLIDSFEFATTSNGTKRCTNQQTIYMLDYNVPILMLAVNKNAYGENLTRLISNLESGTDMPVALLDSIWYITKHPIKALNNLALSISQLFHNAFTNLGIGNPFIGIVASDFIIKYRMPLFVVTCGLLGLGVFRICIRILQKKTLPNQFLGLIGRAIVLSFVPMFIITSMCDCIAVITGLYLNRNTTKLVAQGLSYQTSANKIVDEKLTFFDNVNDADQDFFRYSIRNNKNEKIALSKLYNDVSYRTWFDTSIGTPWYSPEKFMPVHRKYYKESIFYYFYDWITYQYLGYLYTTDPSCDVKLLTKSEEEIPNLDCFKDRVGIGYRFYSSNEDLLDRMYKDKSYTFSEIKEEVYTKDVLGLSNLFNKVDTSVSGKVKIYDDSKDYNVKVTEKFTYSYVSQGKDLEVYYPIFDVFCLEWKKSNKLCRHNMMVYDSSYCKLYEKLPVPEDYMDIPETGRIPGVIYASEANIFSADIQATTFERYLSSINEKYISSFYSSDWGTLKDTDKIFVMAVKATLLFNKTLGLKGSSLESDLSLSSVMKSVYLPVSGNYNSFTYSLMKRYGNTAVMPICVVVSELFLVLTALARNLLLVLLVGTSLRFSMSIFLSNAEIKRIFQTQVKQCLIYIIIYVGIILSLIFANFTVDLINYSLVALIVAVLLLILYYAVFMWAFFQVECLFREFKTFGETRLSQKLQELKDLTSAIFNNVEVSTANVQKSLIHRMQIAPTNVSENNTPYYISSMRRNIETEEEETNGS